MERASLHVTRSSLFNFVGERKRNDQNSTSILVISVFLPRFNANSHHYYYRIRKVLRNHTRCCEQRSIFILLLTMGAVETRPSRKMPIRILGVFFATLHFITSSNHGVQGKRERRSRHLDGCRFIETTLGVVSNALAFYFY